MNQILQKFLIIFALFFQSGWCKVPKIPDFDILDNNTWDDLVKTAQEVEERRTKFPSKKFAHQLQKLSDEEILLKLKSQQFLNSYENLKIAYSVTKKKLKETEETCLAQAEILNDWNKYVNKENIQKDQNSEDSIGEKVQEIYAISKENYFKISKISGQFDKIIDPNSTLFENQLSLEAEISKISNLIRKNDDLALERIENILKEIRILRRNWENERVFFEETFTDVIWEKRWASYLPGFEKDKNYQIIQQGPPYFINSALRTKEAMSYQQGIYARFPEFSSKKISLVIQYTLKFSIGDMFLRLHSCGTQFTSISSWDSYLLFFGNRNSQGNGNKNQLILYFKDPQTGGRFEQNILLDNVKGPTDGLTHIYTLEIDRDNNFRILIDDTMVLSDYFKLSFFGFSEICGISFFNQDNPLSMEIDNILLTSDLNFAKQRRLEILQFMAIEKDFEIDSSLGSGERSGPKKFIKNFDNSTKILI